MSIAAFEHYLEVLQTYLRGDTVAMADAVPTGGNVKLGLENLAIGVAPAAQQAMPRTRQAVLAELILHARLVAKQIRRLRIGAMHAERLADLAELHRSEVRGVGK